MDPKTCHLITLISVFLTLCYMRLTVYLWGFGFRSIMRYFLIHFVFSSPFCWSMYCRYHTEKLLIGHPWDWNGQMRLLRTRKSSVFLTSRRTKHFWCLLEFFKSYCLWTFCIHVRITHRLLSFDYFQEYDNCPIAVYTMWLSYKNYLKYLRNWHLQTSLRIFYNCYIPKMWTATVLWECPLHQWIRHIYRNMLKLFSTT